MVSKLEICEGGCTCGNVRYELKSKPIIVHCCHCRLCQQQTGSAFAVNALIETDRVEVTRGQVVENNVSSPSGSGQRIWRCPTCQIALWSNYMILFPGKGQLVSFIRAGTLDEPHRFPPDIHIYISTKQPWVVIPSDVPAVENFYKISSTWSKDGLRRRDVMLSASEN